MQNFYFIDNTQNSMKKFSLVIIIILSQSAFLFAQTIKVGGSADILIGCKNLNYMFGPNIMIEYIFADKPFSFLGLTNFYISELSGENKYLQNFSYNTFSIGTAIHYYPISWAIEPYSGFSLMYHINNISQPGNAHFIDGKQISLRKVYNNITADFSIGVLFSANTPINFVVEISYKLNQPKTEIALISDPVSEMITNYLNFNLIFVRIGLITKI